MGWCSMNYNAAVKNPLPKTPVTNRSDYEYLEQNRNLEYKLANLYQIDKDKDSCSKITRPFQKTFDKNFHASSFRKSV